MSDVLTNGHVAWLIGPETAFTDAEWVDGPSLGSLQSLENFAAAIKVDGSDFNLEASEQVDDRSFADRAGTQSRGALNASGSMEIYTPGKNDKTSIEARAWAAISKTRTRLALAQRFVATQGRPVAPGDVLNVFRVITDDRQHNRNDASRTLGTGLVLQGDVLPNYIVPSAAPQAVTVTPAGPQAIGVGEALFLAATYEGHNVTAGAEWLSTDETVLTITKGGVAYGVRPGTAEVTVSVPGSAEGIPLVVTVEA